MHKQLRVGDQVKVTPRGAAIGKGLGEVVYVGPAGTLVRVKFPDCKYPLACFVEDCVLVATTPTEEVR